MGLASAIVGQLIIAAAEVIWPSNRDLGDDMFSVSPILTGASLVITGEGRYDQTSGDGKVVGAVAAAAVTAGVPAALVAGLIGGPPGPGLSQAVALAELAGDPAAAMADPARWLRQAGRQLAGSLILPGPEPLA